MPRTAQALTILADKHGWKVWATYAEGYEEVRKEQRPCTSIAVRMRRGDKRVAAMWVNGKFHRGWVHGAPPRRLSSAQVKELISSE